MKNIKEKSSRITKRKLLLLFFQNKVEKSQSIKELGKKGGRRTTIFSMFSLLHIKLTNLLFIDERKKIKHLEGKFFPLHFFFMFLNQQQSKCEEKRFGFNFSFFWWKENLDLEIISNFNAFLIEIIALLFSNKNKK